MNERSSILLLIAMLSVGALAVSRPTPPTDSPHSQTSALKPAAKAATAPTDDSDAQAVVQRLLRQFWGLPDGTDSRTPTAATEKFRAGSTVVIATVPDPVDSRMGPLFDQYLEALQLAASAAGYTLDRFWLPWHTTPEPADSAIEIAGTNAAKAGQNQPGRLTISATSNPAERKYRTEPGVLLFRDSTTSNVALAVLLVGETPTTGIQAPALQAALTIAAALKPDRDITIVGPAASGTAPTLANAIGRWRAGTGEARNIRLFGAGATATSVQTTLGKDCATTAASQTCFRSLTWSSEDTQMQLGAFLTGHGATADNSALFVEAGTVYGSTAGNKNPPLPVNGTVNGSTAGSQNPLLPGTRIGYPLHISEARSAYAQAGLLLDEADSLNSHTRSILSLSFDDVGGHSDTPPVFYTSDAAGTADLELSVILAALRRKDIQFVGILGSDAQDKLFLAREIKRRMPNVQLYTILADISYLHPEWSRDLTGMWVASPYPLIPTREGGSTREETVFPSHAAQTAYNALLAALISTSPADGAKLSEHLVGYWRRDQKGAVQPGPYLWISAVGTGDFWPLVCIAPTSQSEFLWAPEANQYAPAHPEKGWKQVVQERVAAGARLIHDGPGLCLIAWVALLLSSFALLLPPVRERVPDWLSDLRVVFRSPWATAGWITAVALPMASAIHHASFFPAVASAADPNGVDAAAARSMLWDRAVHFSSGLSPVVPSMLLALSALLLLFGWARRHRWSRSMAKISVVGLKTQFEPYVERIRAALGDPSSRPRPVWPFVAGGCAAAAAVLGSSSPVRGMDPAWALIARIGFCAIVAAVAFAICQFYLVWGCLRSLLRALRATPLPFAFERLPARFGETLGLGWLRRSPARADLRHAVDQLSVLSHASGPLAAAASRSKTICASFARERRHDTELPTIPSRAERLTAQAAARMLNALEAIWRADLQRDLAPAARSAAAMPNEMDRDAVDRCQTRAADLKDRQVRLAEEFVAAELTRYFGYVFLHLRILLMTSMGAAILLLFMIASYPFNPEETLMRFIVGCLLALMTVFLVVLIQSDRNPILSRAANRTPNRVDFDAKFIGQLGTYVGVPILTLLVTQFPAIDALVQRLRGF